MKRLEAEGWTLERGGKHQVKMTKPGRRPIALPATSERRIRRASRPSCGGRPGSRNRLTTRLTWDADGRSRHTSDGQGGGRHLWATVDEFPGVFGTGDSLEELRESLAEGISLYLAEEGEELKPIQLAPLSLQGAATRARS
jgi:predicted RNase H-like HicB family nuclease